MCTRVRALTQLPRSAVPFMGPNLYMAPGGAFTGFHQDGTGTVDSGHSCLTGYNEVVMLRRLPENHKVYAMSFVEDGAVYGLPHDRQVMLVLLFSQNV